MNRPCQRWTGEAPERLFERQAYPFGLGLCHVVGESPVCRTPPRERREESVGVIWPRGILAWPLPGDIEIGGEKNLAQSEKKREERKR